MGSNSSKGYFEHFRMKVFPAYCILSNSISPFFSYNDLLDWIYDRLDCIMKI